MKNSIASILLVVICLTPGLTKAQDAAQYIQKFNLKLDSLDRYSAVIKYQESNSDTTLEKATYQYQVDTAGYRYEDNRVIIVSDTQYAIKLNKVDSTVTVSLATDFIRHNLLAIQLPNYLDKAESKTSNGSRMTVTSVYKHQGNRTKITLELDTSTGVIEKLVIKQNDQVSSSVKQVFKITQMDTNPSFNSGDFDPLKFIRFKSPGTPSLRRKYSSYQLINQI